MDETYEEKLLKTENYTITTDTVRFYINLTDKSGKLKTYILKETSTSMNLYYFVDDERKTKYLVEWFM